MKPAICSRSLRAFQRLNWCGGSSEARVSERDRSKAKTAEIEALACCRPMISASRKAASLCAPGRAYCDAAARPLAVRMTRPSLSARRSMNPSRLGVADRLPEVRTPKADVTADVFSSPPRGRALDAEAVKLGDERRCTLKTVSGDHRPMLPQLCGMCQQ